MRKVIIILLLSAFFYQCKDTAKSYSSEYDHSIYDEEENTETSYSNDYHVDPDYKYEYRTGSSGNYEYNYDVNGYDEYGNPIEGTIDVSNGEGSGYIYDEEGNEKTIDVEFTGYGELEGYDEDGNYYDLNVD